MSQVVLVHGIWVNGLELWPLGRRLHGCGFTARRFPYADLRRGPADNARLLQRWLQRVPGEQVHFVGHSFGGIVLLHLFDLFPQQRPGRVVFLGTPALGSAVARRMYRSPLLKPLLGRAVEKGGLLGGAPTWRAEHELGLLGGTTELGIGRLFCRLESPHDGTVALSETEVAGARERVTVAASHTGMLFSPDTARQLCAFLQTGRFLPHER